MLHSLVDLVFLIDDATTDQQPHHVPSPRPTFARIPTLTSPIPFVLQLKHV